MPTISSRALRIDYAALYLAAFSRIRRQAREKMLVKADHSLALRIT